MSIILNGLICFSDKGQCVAEIVVSFRQVRLELHGLLVAFNGLVDFFLF